MKKFSASEYSVKSLLQVNSTHFAVGSDDSKIYLYNVNTFAKLKSLSGHSSTINSLSLMLNSNLLVSASSDNTVKIWNLELGQVTSSFSPFPKAVYYARVLDNGSIIVGGYNKSLSVWTADASGANPVRTSYWDNFFPKGKSFDAVEYNGRIIASDLTFLVKLIDETTNQHYLSFSTPEEDDQIAQLKVLSGISIK